MSFRARLTSFFVVIVVVPMIAVGFLVFRLIDQSDEGKADARASGLASAAASIYQSESAGARSDATTIARNVAALRGAALRERARSLATEAGLARVTVSTGSKVMLDVGARNAVAPGVARIRAARAGVTAVITASELSAPDYARELLGPGVAVVIRQGSRTLSSTVPLAAHRPLPRRGTISVAGSDYRGVMQVFRGFGATPVDVTVLSKVSATATSAGSSRVLAAAFIVGFLLLALAFSVLASRALQDQIGRFLEAARRLRSGRFLLAGPDRRPGRVRRARRGVQPDVQPARAPDRGALGGARAAAAGDSPDRGSRSPPTSTGPLC
jgi:hypothetical protein